MRTQLYSTLAALAVAIGVAGCQSGTPNKAPASGSGSGSATGAAGIGSGSAGAAGSAVAAGSAGSAAAPPEIKDIDSKDILSRSESASKVSVKHVLIAWKELAAVYRGRIDAKAAKRTNAEAAAFATETANKLKASPDTIDAVIRDNSDDPTTTITEPYTVTSDSILAPELKNLALHLKENEVGIVHTRFGYDVMMRVPTPPPDPLESADILARPPQSEPVWVQHIVIGWKDLPGQRAGHGDKRAAARSKQDADKLAVDVLGKVRAKGDMDKLMKEYSEDPNSQNSQRPFRLGGQVPAGFETLNELGKRLKMNEAGMVKTLAGWFILKRVAEPPPPAAPPPPPPLTPDALESADILKREPVTQAAKVKHILLGWKDLNAGDDRGKTRDRATLEKLVKSTVAKLQGGAKIEPLMAELSEDPGSAKTGIPYDVTPDAGLVEPFKKLSLRLKVGEVGVVKTNFGLHIIQRVE